MKRQQSATSVGLSEAYYRVARAGVTSANLYEPHVAATRSCSNVNASAYAYRKPTLLAPVRYSVASHYESAGTPVTRECLSNVHRSVRQGKAWQPPQYRILVSLQSQVVELTNSPNVRTQVSRDQPSIRRKSGRFAKIVHDTLTLKFPKVILGDYII